MDRREGDDELSGAPERTSVDASRPDCRRFLPARVRRIRKDAGLGKGQDMHRHRRSRPGSESADKDGTASPERYPRVFKDGRQMSCTDLFLPIIVATSTDCSHAGRWAGYE